MEVPQFYATVTSLLLPPAEKVAWVGMKTLGQLKRERAVTAPLKEDSLYKVCNSVSAEGRERERERDPLMEVCNIVYVKHMVHVYESIILNVGINSNFVESRMPFHSL